MHRIPVRNILGPGWFRSFPPPGLAVAAVLLLLAGGCAVKFTELSGGMETTAVVDRLGRPGTIRTNDQGRTQWIYFDVPLDEPPRTDVPDGTERLRMRLAERNPAFFHSAPSRYKMTLLLTFDGTGKLVETRTMVRETGTVFPRPRSGR